MRAFHMEVREARMFVGRILLSCGLPSGAVHGVQECILLSQALGLGGFAHLLKEHESLDWGKFKNLTMKEDNVLDGGGLHAWLALPTIMDLAVEQARRTGVGKLKLLDFSSSKELAIVTALAKRYGATAEISGTLLTVRNASRPVTAEQWDPLLLAALRDGYQSDEATWKAMHALGNRALAPDSVASRRHAGPVVLADDGSLLGRIPQDDDFDMNMLIKVGR
jgi:hypothetical protein